MKAVEHPAHAFKVIPGDVGYSGTDRAPGSQKDLQRAADVINAGKRVAILVGQGARGATAEAGFSLRICSVRVWQKRCSAKT